MPAKCKFKPITITIVGIVLVTLLLGAGVWLIFTQPMHTDDTVPEGLHQKIQQAGTVVAWGHYGKVDWCTAPEGLTNAIAVATGEVDSIALTANGTVVAFREVYPTPDNLTNVTAIAAGQSHYLALLANGTVVAWGYGGLGQCDVPVGLTNVTAIAAGRWHSLALLANGTVVAWGDNWFGGYHVPPEIQGMVVAINGGEFSTSRTILTNGTIVEWERECDHPPTVYSNFFDATAVAGGLVLLKNGTVTTLSGDAVDVPGGSTNVTAISSQYCHHLAIKADGTIVEWGRVAGGGKNLIPAVLPDWMRDRKVLAIAAGISHSVAIVAD